MYKELELKEALSHADVVIIEVISSQSFKGRTSSHVIRLVSGMPESDAILDKIKNSLGGGTAEVLE